MNTILQKNTRIVLISTMYLLTATLLIIRYYFSSYGIDFTDEGFYIASIKNPFAYPSFHTQFGFFYHTLYEFLHGNLVALRNVVTFTTFTLSSVCIYILFTKTLLKQGKQITLLCIALGFASTIPSTSILLSLPSYNILTLHGILIATIGLLLSKRICTFSSTCGWILIGIGGWMTFLGKPTSAALLSIVVFVSLIVLKKISLSGLVMSVVTCCVLLYISVVYIDNGSITMFINRHVESLELLKIFQANHSILSSFRLPMPDFTTRDFILAFVVYISVFLSIIIQKKLYFPSEILFTLCSLVFVGLSIFTTVTLPLKPKAHPYSIELYTLILGLVTLLQCIKQTSLKETYKKNKHCLYISIFIVCIPYMYTFGSNCNYWYHQATISTFWLLPIAIIYLNATNNNNKIVDAILLGVIAIQCMTILAYVYSAYYPYRQPYALCKNTIPTQIGENTTLYLAPKLSAYINNVRSLAYCADFKKNTPIIDLTGVSGGLIYAIEGYNIGYPWVAGGYPGSMDFMIKRLQMCPIEDVRRAWVLMEPGGPREIPPKVLEAFGLDCMRDYDIVGSIVVEECIGGIPIERKQLLLKPKNVYNK